MPRHVTSPHVTPRDLAYCHVTSPRVMACRVKDPKYRVFEHGSCASCCQAHSSRHVTSRHVTSRHVTSRHVTSRHVTSRHVTSRHVTSRSKAQGIWYSNMNCARDPIKHLRDDINYRIKSRHVTSSHVTSRHLTSCPVTVTDPKYLVFELETCANS